MHKQKQKNAVIYGRGVLSSTAITAGGQQVKTYLATYIATVSQTSRRWSTLYYS
jgi:hypothetical protein